MSADCFDGAELNLSAGVEDCCRRADVADDGLGTEALDPVASAGVACLQVRLACVEDAAAVFALYDAVVEDNSGSEYDVLWRRDLHPSDAALLEAMGANALYVAERQGCLHGAAVVNDDFAEGYDSVAWEIADSDRCLCLHLFCVAPHSQGQGVGSVFLRGILDDCRTRGVSALRLDVFAHNKPARALYEKVGFHLRGITRLAYEDQKVGMIDFAMYEYVL